VFAILMAAAFVTVRDTGPATDFVHASYQPPLNADGAILWATMVFAFGGAEALAFLRGDIHGGVGKIVRVLVVVGILLVIGYGLGTSSMLAILTPEQTTRLSGVPEALRMAFVRLGAPELGRPAVLLLGLSMLGGFSAWYGVAARLPFVIGVDRYLPAAFARKNPKTGAPTVSILVQTLAVVVLVLLSQAGAGLKAAYDFLVQMTVLSYTLPFLFLFAVYVVVQKRRAPEGEWSAPGGRGVARLIGWVGFVVTLSAVLCTLVPSPSEPDKQLAITKLVVASAVLILGGVPIWAVAKLRKPKPAQ
jgi:amino acid transporter